MMKNIKILLPFFLVSAIFVGLTVYNLMGNIKSNKTIVTIQDYPLCFMVPDIFELTAHKDGFSYVGGKNKGTFEIIKGTLNQNFSKKDMGGIEAVYSKMKNFRVVEYKIDDMTILRNKFEAVIHLPANLTPTMGQGYCDTIKKLHPKHLAL